MLQVMDHRGAVQLRAFGPPGGPLSEPPRSTMAPNENDPAVGSVGPNVPVEGDTSAQELAEGGYGATHVLYPADNPPPHAAAWAGWPVEWGLPDRNTQSVIAGMPHVDVVFMCIDLNARVIADMPVYGTRTMGGQTTALQLPSWADNPEPRIYGHWGEFVKQLVFSLQATGEAFVLCTSRFDNGYPRTFMMLSPWYVDVEMNAGIREYRIAGIRVEDGDLLHLRYVSWPDQPHGIGPLEYARERLMAVRTLIRYGSDLARNGGVPWAVLKHKYRLGEGQAQKLKAQWIASARNRMGAPAVLDSDLDLQVLQVTPKDMALSEMQQHSESRIATLLGVPPFLVGLPTGGDSMTYANTTSLYDFHWRTTLNPMADNIEASISAWALPGGSTFEFNPSSYVAADLQTRIAYYQAMREMGVITAEEIRAAEKLAPMTGRSITDA